MIGSARLDPPDPRCALAEQVGTVLAARGWTIMTGGYGGLMAVAARAAAEAGGRVIGLPMRGWAHLEPSPWSHELRWSQDYPERLGHFLTTDAVVVLDGGIGTLAEASLVWAARQTEPRAPELVFVGRDWLPVLRSLAAHLVIDDRDLACVTTCAGAKEAADHIAGIRTRYHPRGRARGDPAG